MDNLSEIKYLRQRVAELEKENTKLNGEASLYLGNWVAAQDALAWRHVLLLARQDATLSFSLEMTG